MKKLAILALTFSFIQLVSYTHAQTTSEAPQPAKLLLEVSIEPTSRHLHFRANHQLVPNDDLIEYLRKHDEGYETAVAYILAPPTLTVQEIGAVKATLNKAGYHKIRSFLSAVNSDFAVEVVFEPQVPLREITDK